MGRTINQALQEEELLSFSILVITLFITSNVSPQVGNFYTGMALIYFGLVVAKRRDLLVEFWNDKHDLLDSLVMAVGVWLAWILLVNFVFRSLGTEMAFAELFETLRAQTNIPIFSENSTLQILAQGVVIPIVESFFFLSFILKGILSDTLMGLRLRWHRIASSDFLRMMLVVALVGVSGSIFHLTVRLAENLALFADFFFFGVSALLVFKRGQLFEAAVFHVMVNTAVLLVGNGIL